LKEIYLDGFYSMEIVVIEVDVARCFQVIQILQLFGRKFISSLVRGKSFFPRFLLNKRREPEIQENPLLKAWAPPNIVAFDVSMNDLESVHHLHACEQIRFAFLE
jgi:hypothetical protein